MDLLIFRQRFIDGKLTARQTERFWGISQDDLIDKVKLELLSADVKLLGTRPGGCDRVDLIFGWNSAAYLSENNEYFFVSFEVIGQGKDLSPLLQMFKDYREELV